MYGVRMVSDFHVMVNIINITLSHGIEYALLAWIDCNIINIKSIVTNSVFEIFYSVVSSSFCICNESLDVILNSSLSSLCV